MEGFLLSWLLNAYGKEVLTRITRKGMTRVKALIGAAKESTAKSANRKEVPITQRQQHLLLTLDRALEGLYGKRASDIDPIPPDLDWLERWREGAEKTSSDDIREMWARILTGEMEQPGSFSLGTLQLLDRITTPEAEKIALLGMMTCDGEWIPRIDDEFLKDEGVHPLFLIRMADLGVISSSTLGALSFSRGLKHHIRDSSLYGIENQEVTLLMRRTGEGSAPNVPVILLTEAGKEILRVCSVKANKWFLERVGRKLEKDGFLVSAQIGGKEISLDKLTPSDTGIARLEFRASGLRAGEGITIRVHTSTGYEYTQVLTTEQQYEGFFITIPSTSRGRFVGAQIAAGKQWKAAYWSWYPFMGGEPVDVRRRERHDKTGHIEVSVKTHWTVSR